MVIQRRSKRLVTFVALVSAAFLVAGFPSQALPDEPSASPTESSASESEVRETALDLATSAVRALAGGAGFHHTHGDLGAATLDVYWKRPIPREVLALDETSLFGFGIRVFPTLLSAEDVLTASAKLVDAKVKGTVPSFSWVSGDDAGGGLVVAVPDASLTPLAEADRTTKYSARAGLPVSLRLGESRGEAAARQTNSAPWKGGAGWYADDEDIFSGYCSVAFAVKFAGGGRRMLGATHCNQAGDDLMLTPQNVTFSTSGAVQTRLTNDTMLINPVSDPSGKIYVGGINSNTVAPVLGAGSPSPGGSVCTGGSNSGEHCSLDIIGDQPVSDVCFNSAAICTYWRASDINSTAAAVVGGDSGGPVYRSVTGGVSARGVIYGGSVNRTCPTTFVNTSKCFGTVYFMDIGTLMNTWGVSIVLGN